MGEYRERTTGEVKSQGQWRADFPNMSLPKVWKAATLDAMNLDPVLSGPKPHSDVGNYQSIVRDGVVQDANDNWVENWVVRDMFADTTEDGVTTTKSQHEAAYQATLDADTAAGHRATRDSKLAETDFYALSDVTMSDAMATYRQALRDLPDHSNWPNLQDSDWPTKP